ncbi:MAG: M15 family metallopeptidase [Actinomycetes bacterium]
MVGPRKVDPVAVADQRRKIAAAIADKGSALAVAQETARRVLADLAAADARLAAAQANLNASRAAAQAATERVETARAAARRADATYRRLRARVTTAAVGMYVDPPQRVQVAALSGGVREAMIARGLLSARAALTMDRLSEARRARKVADDREREADEAADAAEATQSQANAEVNAVLADVAERQRAVDLAQIAMTALSSEVGSLAGLDANLSQRLNLESTVGAGSISVVTGADGSWSVNAVGFPSASEMVRIGTSTVWVHPLIADRASAMFLAAAMEGVRLDGWAFRSTARQVELRRAHCGGSFDSVFNAPSSSCSPPTARPGRSMHERGLAIDFKNCSSRSTACYQWLALNAARFGLFNLPSEPWHWSVNGN